ncbi:MAG: hypothetical protein ACSHYC_03235 [Alphaproteobacteria bacterium]
MDTEGPKADSVEAGSASAGEYSVYLNRKVMGIWLAATCLVILLEAFALISGVGSGIDWFLLIAFVGVGAVLALHVFDTRPVLIVNQHGVHDRRISRQIIPWDAMLWYKIEAQPAMPFLGVGLVDEVAKQVGVHPWAMLFKNQPAPFGKLKGYRIWPHRTLGERHEFVRAVQRFAPPMHDR